MCRRVQGEGNGRRRQSLRASLGWQLKLVPLHDEARYASAAATLRSAAAGGREKGSGLDEALAAADKEATDKEEKAKAERGRKWRRLHPLTRPEVEAGL